ncbi:MAG TPA: efflux RND transporter periplasmic adaptor subunit [Gemmatimonadaceae bacterium]|nr:efflux RND transporter periplasmic adaptor subunit [Gemmatimonadaceae bacterium]
MHHRSLALRALFVIALASSVACGDDKEDQAQAAQGPNGGGGGSAGGAVAPGGGGPSVALSTEDVATARRAPIEESVPLTGDLRPIETVDVRARIEGDIIGVYVREGSYVREGQLLAQFEAADQESLRQSALASRAAAQSALSTAQWNLDQTRELFKAGAVPERDVRSAEQAVATARAQLAAAEAQVRAASTEARDTRVVAPTTGTLERRLVESGEHVTRGTPLFTVVRTNALELAATVPARYASNVRTGQITRFTADGRSIEGRVVRVSPTIDPATRSITVYVQVPNPSGALKGGTFVAGRVVGRSIPEALVIPGAAVRQDQDGSPYVYTIEGETVAQKPVKVGVVDDATGIVEIVSGLEEGDRVIVGNVGTLGRGMQVRVVDPTDQPVRR